jgi:hypothetical protein
MRIFRYTAIGTVILFLFCGTAVTAEKPGQKAPPSQSIKAIPKTQVTPMVKVLSKVVIDDVSIPYGEAICLQAKLTGPDGRPLGGKTVNFTVNLEHGGDLQGTRTTGPSGIALWNNTLYASPHPGGTYVIEARFDGDATTPPAAPHKGRLTIQKLPTAIKDMKFEDPGAPTVKVANLLMGKKYLIRGLVSKVNMSVAYFAPSQVVISINNTFLKNCLLSIDETGGGKVDQCEWTPPIANSPFVDYAVTIRFEGNDGYLPATATKNVRAVPMAGAEGS